MSEEELREVIDRLIDERMKQWWAEHLDLVSTIEELETRIDQLEQIILKFLANKPE